MEDELQEVLTIMKLFSITVTMDTGWWEAGRGHVWCLGDGEAVHQNVMVSKGLSFLFLVGSFKNV